jgi:hypothetical protein
MMDETRFKALAEAYGGDFARWPEAEREAAAVFVADHLEQAAPILSEASALDQLLASPGALQASPALEEAILASAPIARPLARPQPAPRWAGIAAAFALIAGAGAGWIAAPGGDPYADLITADAFGALESADGLVAITQEDAR